MTEESAEGHAADIPHVDPKSAPGPRVSPRLLEALVCPATGTRLDYDAEAGELISRTAALAYPIRSGLPIMLIDEARKL